MKGSSQNTPLPPDFTAEQVRWLQALCAPKIRTVPPSDVANPCERMALACAQDEGRDIIMRAVLTAYKRHRELEK